jgi:hypothetical protein
VIADKGLWGRAWQRVDGLPPGQAADTRARARGLAQRIAQRLLALTIGILLNTLSGRPARALAAYDGR